jgi:hypothetical protein
VIGKVVGIGLVAPVAGGGEAAWHGGSEMLLDRESLSVAFLLLVIMVWESMPLRIEQKHSIPIGKRSVDSKME